MIVITFALPAESSDIVRRLHERRVETRDPKTIRGKLFDRDVVILHTGVGRRACQRSIDSFFNAAHPKFIISSGFAGAVTEKFKVGDLIVAENFSDPKLAVNLGKPGKLFTASSIIDSSEERNQIAREKGADAVDMETEVIAQACAAHGVAMVSLRAISDTPTEPFPFPANILFNIQRQQTEIGKLLAYLAIHPRGVWRLIQFWRQIAAARRGLTSALFNLVQRL